MRPWRINAVHPPVRGPFPIGQDHGPSRQGSPSSPSSHRRGRTYLTGKVVPCWQHWSELHTDPSTKLPQYDWDTFVSDFKQRYLPRFLTALEDEFALLTQKGMPIVIYSNKLLTLAQQIGTPDKEKLRTFIRGLNSSIKYVIRNLNPKSYEEALALA